MKASIIVSLFLTAVLSVNAQETEPRGPGAAEGRGTETELESRSRAPVSPGRTLQVFRRVGSSFQSDDLLSPDSSALRNVSIAAVTPVESGFASPDRDHVRVRADIFKDRPSELPHDEMLSAGVIKFIDADVLQVLDIYQELSGRTVMRPTGLPAQKISLRSQTVLSRMEVVQALDSILALNGIIMIPEGKSFVKAVPAAQAALEGAEFSDVPAWELPESGSYVSRMVHLDNILPSRAVPVLQPFAKLPNSIVAVDGSGVLFLRDCSENVKRMLEVVSRLEALNEPNSHLRRVALVLLFCGSLMALFVYPRYLGISLRRSAPLWALALGLGVCAIFYRWSQQPPSGPAEEEAAGVLLSLLFAGGFMIALVAFLTKLYFKWGGHGLTREEKLPGGDGIRAWLGGGNLICALLIAVFAWRGFHYSFWPVLIVSLLALTSYTGLQLLRSSSKPPSSRARPDTLSADRKRVLDLLQKRKITVQKAVELLGALAGTAGPQARSAKPFELMSRFVPAGKFPLVLGLALGIGGIILLSFLTTSPFSASLGTILALLGYGLVWVGGGSK